ncbi:MAG: hypothetical protein RI884_2099 [Pseudomonadota bacterium]|jgi:hypothetical protein
MHAAASQRRLSATQCLAGTAAVAVAYVVFFKLNDWAFSLVKISDHISWVFLPAAIRMLAVMLFGWAGVAGLYLGSLTQLGGVLEVDPARALVIAGISSVPCLVAARLVQRVLRVPGDLAGMTGRQLLVFGVAGGLASSGAHTVYFALEAGDLAPLAGFMPMFVGDTIGTLIVLYVGALVLNRLLPRGE